MRLPGRPAADLLYEARARERAACIPEAIQGFEAAIVTAERTGERAVLAEALRRLAVVRHHRNEATAAWDLCNRSYSVACEQGNDFLAAEALNTLGGLDLRSGKLEEARKHFLQALARAGQTPELLARIEQNLGILANIKGEIETAVSHYERAVEWYLPTNDEHGCANAYVNLGIAHTGAHRLFRRLDARVDLVFVGGKVAELETTYFDLVREWGQSIESADSYTFGHCERVAQHAIAVARLVGLDDATETTIRLGAYLHDLGKVRVPHEILNKPGPLTREEFEIVQMHPIWGLELLAAIEFPWDLKPNATRSSGCLSIGASTPCSVRANG